MKTCTSADCPKTHDQIIRQLCDIYYPYGGIKCHRHFGRWLETEPEVQRLDKTYREEKENEKYTL